YSGKTPGYEINDLGFETRSDYQAVSSIVYYQENTPGRLFRSYYAFPFFNQAWNFGRDLIFNGNAFDFGGQLLNFWSVNSRITYNGPAIDDRLTRGGPQARSPLYRSAFINLTSDSRKSWTLNPGYTHSWFGDGS